jgi:hypothetical protein
MRKTSNISRFQCFYGFKVFTKRLYPDVLVIVIPALWVTDAEDCPHDRLPATTVLNAESKSWQGFRV